MLHCIHWIQTGRYEEIYEIEADTVEEAMQLIELGRLDGTLEPVEIIWLRDPEELFRD